MASSYDQVLYPSHTFPETHPDRMAAIATILGLRPPVDRCRVLEVGCGDGSNLIPMGLSLPGCQMLGIDLAGRPIENGTALVKRLGLSNVELRAMDLLAFPPDLGTFDYIVAHGFCSWVPSNVLDKFFAVCRDHLAPNGIVYASYNAHPQGHLRFATRELMRFHMDHQGDDSIPAAKAFLKLLGESTQDALWRSILERESERMGAREDNALFHDDLNVHYSCFHFKDFIQHAQRYGFQFLSEAKLRDVVRPHGAPGVLKMARDLSGGDEVAFQQYMDFAVFQGFRRTLLCRSEMSVQRGRLEDRIPELLLASTLRFAAESSARTAVFRNEHGPERLETDHPLLISVLRQLEEAWPKAISFADLLKNESTGLRSSDHLNKLQADLLGLVAAALVDLRVFHLQVANKAGNHPMASPLARLQAEQGPLLTSVLHSHVEIKDEAARSFLIALDGTRSQQAIADSMAAQNRDMPTEQCDKFVEDALSGLYRLGLMVA